MNKFLLTLMTVSLFSINAMAAQTTTICVNEIEEFSIKLEKTNRVITNFEIDMPGLDAQTRKDFKYSSKDITSAGEIFVFEKAGISSAEIMIQKVTSTSSAGMLKVHYKGGTQTVLLKCL